MKNLLNLLGDLNPQLFREAKGKLTFRQIALTLTCSLVVQLLFLLNYWGKLPSPFQTENPYCTGERSSISISIASACPMRLATRS
uniref:Uncharacterized protein n=1 Tax=Desertifilum tharense IPPAS B-1220 TaxID=1781255 RepID=A0ACD5H054_9CYAN